MKILYSNTPESSIYCSELPDSSGVVLLSPSRKKDLGSSLPSPTLQEGQSGERRSVAQVETQRLFDEMLRKARGQPRTNVPIWRRLY